MSKVLVTGGSGFIGSHVASYLKMLGHNVDAPSRQELNLLDRDEVLHYLDKNSYDVVAHFASPSPVRSPRIASYDRLFKDSLSIFMNMAAGSSLYGRMLYSGSGAEYDKRNDIILVKEEEIGQSIPLDDYGLAKYIMNDMARFSSNIYNLRIFACFGPGEYKDKFITHAIRCCRNNKPITIRQDCRFDYLYIDDYAKAVAHFVTHAPKWHDYNVTSSTRVLLSAIASIVKEELGCKSEIQISNDGFAPEYTASNQRLLAEMNDIKFMNINEAIHKYVATKGVEWE